jgi:hypothetical protein
LASLIGDDAEQVQRIRMLGIAFENLAIERFGAIEAPRLMVNDGSAQGAL